MSGQTVPTSPGAYVGNDSTVNLSMGPIRCAIVTPRPLAPNTWTEVERLARAVSRCAAVVDDDLLDDC